MCLDTVRFMRKPKRFFFIFIKYRDQAYILSVYYFKTLMADKISVKHFYYYLEQKCWINVRKMFNWGYLNIPTYCSAPQIQN